MRAASLVAALVAAAAALNAAGARAAEPRPSCAAAELAGRFFVARGDGLSWTLLLDEHCGYTSLRFTGDPALDVAQPTKGQGRLAQVDARDVLILQSPEGEFAHVLSVVRAEGRTYLVPTNQHLRFCVEWSQGVEPRKGPIGRFLMRAGDERRPAARAQAPAICRQR
jgi:hypothetical protein